MNWLQRIFHRRRLYDDLAEEVREHIEEKTEQLMRLENLSRPEAEQAARRAFGNLTLVQERSHAIWQWSLLESVLADVKFAFRRLRKSPGFALTVLLTLAIGIGANAAVFSVINRVLLEPLPYPDSDRLIALWLNAPGGGLANFSSGLQLSPSMYFTFARYNRSFQSIGIWTMQNANVTGLAQPEEVHAALVSDGVLQTLDVRPALGRWFSSADQDPHGAPTVMLSYGYWQRRFGGDRSVIGRSIQVDAQTREIVGVMPRDFRMVDHDFDLLAPLALDPNHQKLAPFGYDGIARLKPGVALGQAEADVARLIPVWMDSWSNGPGTNPHYYEIWHITPNFRSLKQQVTGGIGDALWIVMGTVGLVLLIACANLANLMLVRAEARHQELSIRAALGAGRARIARELLLESVLLGAVGGAVALAVAYGGLRLLVALGPAELPRLSEIALDARSVGFTLLLAVVSGLLFGSVPALRYASSKQALTLSGTNRTSSTGRNRQRSRNVLVVAQVAMALVLLVSALLMIRTFVALRSVAPGFAAAQHVQTFRISVPDLLIRDPQAVALTENEIVGKLAAIPGVNSAGFAAVVPMEGLDSNWDELFVEGKNYAGGDPPIMLYDCVSPGYFSAMGTRLVAGRDFTWDDSFGLHPMVIVSEGFARENWGSAAAAVGKRVKQFSKLPWQQVIGVVEDVRQHGVDEKAPAIVYWPAMIHNPYAAQPAIDVARSVRFAVRSDRAGTAGFLNQVQEAVWSVNQNLPLASVETMQAIYSQSLARTSFTLVMLGIAGAMALALGITGIYGVISYAVAQRSREIGTRLALGAQLGLLRWMFVRSALRLTGVGIVIGLGAAGALAQLLRSVLFGVNPLDPLTFAAVPLILAAAAALASYIPASRAAAVDPVDALKME
jgi:predicted permease